MRHVLFALVLTAVAVCPVLADELCTEKEWQQPGNLERCRDAEAEHHRWKVSLGYLAVGATSMARPDLDVGWRVDEGIRRWTRNYYYEYLIPRVVGLNSRPDVFDFFLRGNTLCCTEDSNLFSARDFTGQVGDIYRLWGSRRLESFEQEGTGFAASMEYRIAGGLWGAFSFQMSPQFVTKLTEREGYVQVTEIERFMAQEQFNFSSPIPYWRVYAGRHDRVSEVEHKQKAFQLGFLAKYDLTRDHRHWSVMPQVGVDVLLIRQEEYRVDRIHDWRIFSGEYHPSEWAHEPREVDSRVVEEKTWHDSLRPVAGLTLELWPGKKWNGIGFVVDARYHFTDATSVLTYDSFPAPYELEIEHRPLTLSTSLICRF